MFSSFCNSFEYWARLDEICGCLIFNWVTVTWHKASMITSSNGNIFRVTGPFCREFNGKFPSQRPVRRSFDVFFDLRLNKRLSKQSRRRWLQTPSRSSWRHCNEGTDSSPVIAAGRHCLTLWLCSVLVGISNTDKIFKLKRLVKVRIQRPYFFPVPPHTVYSLCNHVTLYGLASPRLLHSLVGHIRTSHSFKSGCSNGRWVVLYALVSPQWPHAWFCGRVRTILFTATAPCPCVNKFGGSM